MLIWIKYEFLDTKKISFSILNLYPLVFVLVANALHKSYDDSHEVLEFHSATYLISLPTARQSSPIFSYPLTYICVDSQISIQFNVENDCYCYSLFKSLLISWVFIIKNFIRCIMKYDHIDTYFSFQTPVATNRMTLLFQQLSTANSSSVRDGFWTLSMSTPPTLEFCLTVFYAGLGQVTTSHVSSLRYPLSLGRRKGLA